ncbi:MAG TPA: hypothetical protein VEY11_15315 [Pyrinomonadaceae bacterium]|nr:hypothetical protein [Pyrinomonadaceae bacterium]
MESAFIAVGWICGIILLFLIGSCAVALTTMHSDQQVSGEIMISSEWVTITPKERMEPRKQYQSLVLDTAEPLLKVNHNPENIQFADGSAVRPEARIVDDHGKVYDLKMMRAPTPSMHENSIVDVGSLPDDRAYTQVRLRSERPLRLSRVLWHCYNGK